MESGRQIYQVPFDLMGCMTPIPNYVSGDPIIYGGMVYRSVGSGLMVFHSGDYASGRGRCWPHKNPLEVHRAHIWERDGSYVFYCS